MKKNMRGVVLIHALLLVLVIVGFAVTLRVQQARFSAELASDRAQGQLESLLTDALDWRVHALTRHSQDMGSGPVRVVHLGEEWATPLHRFPLSQFVGAGGGQADVEWLLGSQVLDLQGLLNVTNLLGELELGGRDYRAWQRLFQHLGIPHSELRLMVAQLNRAYVAHQGVDNFVESDAPLYPHSVAQLGSLGLKASTLKQLSPFVSVLPERTTLNINTAPAEVLMASLDGLNLQKAREIAGRKPAWTSLAQARRALGPSLTLDDDVHGVGSQYFEIRCSIEEEKNGKESSADHAGEGTPHGGRVLKRGTVLLHKDANDSRVLRRLTPGELWI